MSVFSYFRRLKKTNLRFKLIISASLITALVGLYFLLALRSISPAHVALADLATSWREIKICHEKCSSDRNIDEDIIVKELKKELHNRRRSYLQNQLKLYFQSDRSPKGFKEEIVNIWSLAAGADNPPIYFQEYFNKKAKDAGLDSILLDSFSASSLRGKPTDQDKPLEDYFNILKSSYSLGTRQAVVKYLSNYRDKNNDFSKDQLGAIRDLILDPMTPEPLRQSLVMLTADYYPLFPKTVSKLWEDINNSSTVDEISRLFAVDTINRLTGGNLALPEVSAESWERYYHN